jgi:hypothetical protein
VGATIYFCSFLVIASNIIMALFMAVSAEYVSYDLVVSDTPLVTVGHLQQFQVCTRLQSANLDAYARARASCTSDSGAGQSWSATHGSLNRLAVTGLQRKWSELDPAGSGFIQVWQLRRLVAELGSPLGFRRPPPCWWRLIRRACSAKA